MVPASPPLTQAPNHHFAPKPLDSPTELSEIPREEAVHESNRVSGWGRQQSSLIRPKRGLWWAKPRLLWGTGETAYLSLTTKKMTTISIIMMGLEKMGTMIVIMAAVTCLDDDQDSNPVIHNRKHHSKHKNGTIYHIL